MRSLDAFTRANAATATMDRMDVDTHQPRRPGRSGIASRSSPSSARQRSRRPCNLPKRTHKNEYDAIAVKCAQSEQGSADSERAYACRPRTVVVAIFLLAALGCRARHDVWRCLSVINASCGNNGCIKRHRVFFFPREIERQGSMVGFFFRAGCLLLPMHMEVKSLD